MAVRGMVRAVSRSARARSVTRMFLTAGMQTGGYTVDDLKKKYENMKLLMSELNIQINSVPAPCLAL